MAMILYMYIVSGIYIYIHIVIIGQDGYSDTPKKV